MHKENRKKNVYENVKILMYRIRLFICILADRQAFALGYRSKKKKKKKSLYAWLVFILAYLFVMVDT